MGKIFLGAFWRKQRGKKCFDSEIPQPRITPKKIIGNEQAMCELCPWHREWDKDVRTPQLHAAQHGRAWPGQRGASAE